jgi:nucleotide-binding universal stress UspA family protein
MKATSFRSAACHVVAPPFRSILCGIDGGRADAVLAAQAATLAGPDVRLELVAVSWEVGTGLSAQATLAVPHAWAALDRAVAVARGTGAVPTSRVLEQPDATAALLEEAEEHDLLVLGAGRMHRGAGILLGRPGTSALHRSPCAVLLARPLPAGNGFPQRILFADDGEPAADEAARIVAAIAARHGAGVVIAAPLTLDATQRHRIAGHGEAVMAAGALEPVLADVDGPAHREIPRLARELRSTLVVLGSRELRGPRALRSVSERVAHDAPCSVLVARGG